MHGHVLQRTEWIQHTLDFHAAPAPDGGPLPDFERLDVYRVALEFQARGSAMECAAVLDVPRATGLAPRPICVRGRNVLVRVVQMHTRLCLRLKD